jgi:hypothetical protein
MKKHGTTHCNIKAVGKLKTFLVLIPLKFLTGSVLIKYDFINFAEVQSPFNIPIKLLATARR